MHYINLVFLFVTLNLLRKKLQKQGSNNKQLLNTSPNMISLVEIGIYQYLQQVW